MAWLLLWTAGVAEIIFAVSLKFNLGFTRLLPSILSMAAGAASFYLLTLSLKEIPLGTAYALWTGMGAVGIAIIGIVVFKEAYTWPRLVSMVLVIIGIIGLKLTATA